MSEGEKEAEKTEWRPFSREMPGKAVLVRSHGLSWEVEVAGVKMRDHSFKLEEVRPGEIRARIFYNSHMHFGVVKLRGNGELGLPVFIPSPIDNF